MPETEGLIVRPPQRVYVELNAQSPKGISAGSKLDPVLVNLFPLFFADKKKQQQQ